MSSRIDAILQSARARLTRIEAADVPAALARGALLVDIRPAAQRAAEGDVEAALVIERNVLEWRCDPTSDARIPEAVGDDVEWIILCSEGYRRRRRLPRARGDGRACAAWPVTRRSAAAAVACRSWPESNPVAA